MFLLEDVKLLAALVHGELESYLAKREAARVARISKAECKKQSAATSKAKAPGQMLVHGSRDGDDSSVGGMTLC